MQAFRGWGPQIVGAPTSQSSPAAPAFRGWLPNVAGRLSFSHIGNARNKVLIHRFDSGDAKGRFVVCHQRRKVSDTLLNARYFRWLYNRRPHSSFLLVAKSERRAGDEVGVLVGRVYLIDSPVPDDALKLWGAVSGQVRAQPGAPWRTEAGRLALVADLDATFGGQAWASFAVTIERSGVVTLEPDLATASIPSATDYADVPVDVTNRSASYLVNQAFFFLRDISHTHRHHPRSADTLITAQPLDAVGSWAAETHYRLHRRLVEMRSSHKPTVLFDALGILAYLSSFDALARQCLGKDNPQLKYNEDAIEDSLKARIEASKWRQTQRNLGRTAGPALLIAAVALLRDEDGLGAAAQDLIAGLFPATWTGFMLMVLLLCQLPFWYGIWSYVDNPVSNYVRRIWRGLSRRDHATAWALLSGGILFFPLLVAIFRGGFDVTVLQLGAVLDVILVSLFVLGLPYFITLPDAIRRLRRKPVLS